MRVINVLLLQEDGNLLQTMKTGILYPDGKQAHTYVGDMRMKMMFIVKTGAILQIL